MIDHPKVSEKDDSCLVISPRVPKPKKFSKINDRKRLVKKRSWFSFRRLVMLRKNKEASRQKNELSEKVTFLSSIFSDNFDSFKKFSPKEQLYKKEIEGLNRDQALDYINVLAEKFYMLP